MICNKTQACFFDMLKEGNKEGNFDCSNKEKCVAFFDNRPDATCVENKKAYHLDNSDRKYKVLSLHIDGGVIVENETSKCDYLFLWDSQIEGKFSPIAILIELKGTNIQRAIKQINDTYNFFKNSFSQCCKVYGRIVNSSGVPNIKTSSDFIKLNRELKRHGGNLDNAERNMREEIDKL